MIFYFEFHKPCYPRLQIKSGQCICTLLFVTIGAVSMTMAEVQESAAALALDDLQKTIRTYGQEGLDQMIHDACDKARSASR